MTKTSKGWRATGKKTGKTRIKAETPPATTLGASSFPHVFVCGPPPVSPVPPNPGSGPSSPPSVAPVSLTAPLVPKKSGTSPSKGKKRPRRSVASTVKSYVVPDSDDESILEEHKPDSVSLEKSKEVGKKKAESNLQRWIKHLTTLQKEELKKVSSCWLSSSFRTLSSVVSAQREEKAVGESSHVRDAGKTRESTKSYVNLPAPPC